MGLFPKNLNEFVALMGIPRGPLSNVYLVDTVNGDDDNPGTNWRSPLKSIEAAYAKCTSDQHDVVLMLANDTADNPTAAITWSKDYTHLIGIGCDLPGMGQRCRIVGTSTLDLDAVVTFSGRGCIVKNIQFYNGDDADEDCGAVVVSGGRNLFENCFFAGMAAAAPAARAGSYSLTVTGEENTFKRCSVGLLTILRTAANAELVISGAAYRNKFIDCEFLSWSETAGKFLVKFASGATPWVTQFENCLFENLDMSAAGADSTALTNAINEGSGTKHHIVLRGKNVFVGVSGVADTVTNIFSAEPVPNAGYGLAINPTT